MLIHGNLDEVVSPNYLLDVKDFLIRNKLNVQTLMIEIVAIISQLKHQVRH